MIYLIQENGVLTLLGWKVDLFEFSDPSVLATVLLLKICCFLHWIQSVNPHFYVTLYYNGSLYNCNS